MPYRTLLHFSFITESLLKTFKEHKWICKTQFLR